jgi:signal transduction histidine kinase
MRELRAELAAFPRLGRASTERGLRLVSLIALAWRSVRAKTGLDRAVGLRREVEELRREAERKDGFIALASHELRAPATVVYGFSETLRQRGHQLTRDELTQLHGVLHDQSVRLNHLIDQLLDLSRLEANVVRSDPERLPVRKRLEDLLEAVVGERAAEIDLKVRDDLEILADRTAFERIVSNLVTNAMRYGRAPIEIRAEQNDRHFRLTVADEGEGVAEELVPFLFQRFARGNGAGGSGLGLSIAQSYAQANGGQILYTASGEGGARFQLVLPARRLK